MIIKQLSIKSDKLEEQKTFYTEVIGFPLAEESSNSFSIQIGYSLLRFIRSSNHVPYHFAFNIPSNQEIDALYYLKERVSILKDIGDEIVYFENWNANAVYCYDEDENIVEFIARKRLGKNSIEEFGSHSCIGISEIAMAVDEIEEPFTLLNAQCGIETYSGSVDRFLAAGDVYGLFIIVDKQKKKHWFPTNDRTQSSDFVLEFLNEGELYMLEFKEGKLHLLL